MKVQSLFAMGAFLLGTTALADPPAGKGGKPEGAGQPADKGNKQEKAAKDEKGEKDEKAKGEQADKGDKGGGPRAAAMGPSPEQKKLVAAFNFNGALDTTVTTPDGKTDTFPLRMTCKKSAAGLAVACDLKGKSKLLGAWEGSSLTGYDMGRKEIHFMSMSSDGDVHDHACQWQGDDRITCTPLQQAGTDGKPMTEDLSFPVASGKVTGFEVKVAGEGGTTTFQARKKGR